MGSKSRSRTSSTQSTTDVTTTVGDNRVTDSGIIGGNVTLGQTGGNVKVTTTDFGAIRAGQATSLAALDFGGDAIEASADVATEAIVSAQDISEQAIDLSATAVSDSLSFGEDALDFADDTVRESFGFGSEALGFADDTVRESFGFADDTLEQSLDFADDATQRSLDFASDTFGQSLGAANETVSQFADFGESVLGDAIDSFKFFSQQTNQNTDRALAFATRANTSENAQLLENALKYGSIALGIAGLAFVFRDGFK